MAEDDGFLSRWSKRKAAVQQGVAVPTEPAHAEPAAAPPPVRAEPVLRQAQDDRNFSVRAEPVEAPSDGATGPSTAFSPELVEGSGRTESPPPPTLEDVAQLTRESDFSRFVAPEVDAKVKNAAMKKLFADPHFNQMDGLDIYIDDYNKFEPIPQSMLRQLISARVLGLIDDELQEQPKPDNDGLHDEDAAVQLQPDDAAGRRVAEQGAGPDGAADADDDPPDPVPPRSA